MLLRKTNGDNETLQYVDVINTRGNNDYVLDGKLFKNHDMRTVLVSSASDLPLLNDYYGIGTIAYTAGFRQMWQLAPSGDWVAFS